jgi:hypothetical protein
MARPISPHPRKQSISIAFDTITIRELRKLAKEHNVSVSNAVNTLCGNMMVLLGRLAMQLDEGEAIPEFLLRFTAYTNASGHTEIVRNMNDTVSDDEESMGRGDLLSASTIGHEALGTAIPGASAHTPGREGEGGLSHRPRPRERVRL